MKDFAFTVIIEPDDGSYHAYVPALRGCHSFGETLAEAQANIAEALQLHLECMLEDVEEFVALL
ncbi:MAG: type II toxin-antitoxin system HicB family antitoxin [Chloroflexi bacterium]|nr:type II toxin-antitoxin system HicB family antitoxin [Chloroflexota bacterium]